MRRGRALLRKQLQRLAALTAVAAVSANDPGVLKEIEAALAKEAVLRNGGSAESVVEARIGKRLKNAAACYAKLLALVEKLSQPPK